MGTNNLDGVTDTVKSNSGEYNTFEGTDSNQLPTYKRLPMHNNDVNAIENTQI
jgi:hypothetical protein